jgi:hypothetical protein
LAVAAPPFVPPYPPSAFDRLTDWVDRLPLPAWTTYLGIALTGVAFMAVLRLAGAVEPGGDYTDFVTVIQPWFAFGAMHYLDRMAGAALDATRSLLRVSPEEQASLRYRLTNLPARSVRWALAVGAAFWLLLVFGFSDYFLASARTPLGLVVTTAAGALNITLFPIFVVHTFHQLRTINDLLSRRVRADLFHLRPLYAFSNLTALTAAVWILSGAAWFFFSQPTEGAIGVQVVWTAFDVVLAAFIFLSPLWGIHRLLVQRKGEALAEVARHKQAAYARLHLILERGRSASVDAAHKGLAALEMEASDLHRIPTWPWSPGTPRGVTAAVFLPVIIWLVQFGLERLLG